MGARGAQRRSNRRAQARVPVRVLQGEAAARGALEPDRLAGREPQGARWSLTAVKARVMGRLARLRRERWIAMLRGLGMELGEGVNLPLSTWIDTSHCNLISIGDRCGFGEQCLILAHDAMANEFLDATRVGRVIIHPSCHIGSRTVILPGVEIGPRTIVGAGSVVTRSLPPNSVAAGNPAKVLCTLDELLERHRARMAEAPTFPFSEVGDLSGMSPEARERMRQALTGREGFVVGGYSARLASLGLER